MASGGGAGSGSRGGESPTSGDGRRRRWEAHRATRRLELIEAVVSAVRQRGPEIDLDDITAVSGIAKPVFYRYFTDKADLYLAVTRHVGEQIVADVVAVVDVDRSPRERVFAGVDAFLALVESEPELYRFALQRPATAAGINDLSAVLGRHVSRLVGDTLRAAGLSSGSAEPWGFAMVGAVRAAAERWLDEPTMSRAALADDLTDLLWSGCGSAMRSAARRSAAQQAAGTSPGRGAATGASATGATGAADSGAGAAVVELRRARRR